MLTWSDMQQQFQDLINDESSSALTFGKTNMNLGLSILEASLNRRHTEFTRTGTTSDSTNIVQLPDNFIRLVDFFVTVGTIEYHAEPIFNRDLWNQLVRNTSSPESDFLTHVFVNRNTLELYPRPSTAKTWTMRYEGTTKPLQNDDVTTGTITTLANAGTTVTGSGTSFTDAMINRFLRIDSDGEWYEISDVASTTSLTLRSPYQGLAISAGSENYTIGEVPRTPAPTHIIPVYYACWQWYLGPQKDKVQASVYKNQYDELTKWAKATYGKLYSTNYIPSQRYLKKHSNVINPNLVPKDVT